MSNTLLSNRNPIVERVLGLSQRPMLIAIIAAIGIHGIVLVLLPALNQPKAPDDERVVDLVELPPAAQALLPNNSSPDFILPPLQPDLPNVQFDQDLFNQYPLPKQDSYNFSLDPVKPLPSLSSGGTVYIPSDPFPYAPYPQNKPPVQQQPATKQTPVARQQPAPTPSASPSASPEASPSPSPSTVAQASPTASPQASASPTASPSASPTPQASPTGNSTPQSSGSATSPSTSRDNTLGWYQGVMSSYNNGKFPNLNDSDIKLKQRDISLAGSQASADIQAPKFGVVVHNGKIISGPIPLKGSGDSALDNRAQAEINRHPFSTDKNGPFVIKVNP